MARLNRLVKTKTFLLTVIRRKSFLKVESLLSHLYQIIAWTMC